MVNVPFVRLAEVEIDDNAVRLLGHEYALKFAALPISIEGEFLKVAMAEPSNFNIISDLSDLTGKIILPILAEKSDLEFYIDQVFAKAKVEEIESRFMLNLREDKSDSEFDYGIDFEAKIANAPAVQLVDSLIESAVLKRASDIHIEPYGRNLRVRFRIDGRLVAHKNVDISLLANVISRLKVLGGMDIAEKRMPQDGSFSMEVGRRKIDLRLSTLPTVEGEKIVIRLLKKIRLAKGDLGFFPDDLERLTKLFTRPFGAIFMTGPTGSGKSTTLNCFLEELNDEEKNIVTVEDPVENPIPGISHVTAQRQLTFADALRHILRQDPDIIMVGEIRDEQTARIAISAAITGHVVLSTLHTNDAAGVVERLCDMGLEPYLIAAALNGVVSQRLVRRICRECATDSILTLQQSQILKISPKTPVRCGAGCVHCDFTGFHSRIAIYEYFAMNESHRRKMSEDPAGFAATVRGYGGLRKNALRALEAGFTTADEIIGALNFDEVE